MYRYVIIDDEYLTRAGLLKKVEPLNHLITCVGEAVNGKEGISLIEKLKPDFIITDMYMPVMDGNELLQYVSVHYPNTQIIVISGYRNFEYAQNAIHSNAITYLLKPFSSEDIQSAIQTAIKRISVRGMSMCSGGRASRTRRTQVCPIKRICWYSRIDQLRPAWIGCAGRSVLPFLPSLHCTVLG